MSGGSWDYCFHKLDEIVARLRTCKSPYRRALAEQLALAAKALHDIEWVDSGDYGPGDDLPAIKVALGDGANAKAFEVLCQDARELIARMQGMMDVKEEA